MKFKIKIPKSFVLWVILLCIIAFLFSIFLYPDIYDVFVYVRTAIVGWIILIVLALIGAIFIGMFLSHRILTVGTFTPFEEEMLKMREDIIEINRKLDSLIGQKNMANEEGKEEE